jgi:signal transduction histidine kinase
LRNIDQAAVRLSGLIGDILDVAKLQEGRMSFNPTSFDPDTVVASVVDAYDPRHCVSSLWDFIIMRYRSFVNLTYCGDYEQQL